MPELPEVETIKNQLTHYLPLKIQSIWTSNVVKSILHTPIPRDIKGATLNSIERHGKMMLFQFNRDYQLLTHLGMSGTWIISESKLIEKHQHIRIKTDKQFLTYVDPRRFGHAYFYSQEEKDNYFKRLGPDIASKDLSLKYLKETLKNHGEKELKPFLLDQKYFAGSGNYIANEVCARAKVLPQRKCKTLKDDEIKALKKAFKTVLTGTMKGGGVAFSGGYRDAFGEKGTGLDHLVVFHQKICRMCKKEGVIKVELRKRGTFYCPVCQK